MLLRCASMSTDSEEPREWKGGVEEEEEEENRVVLLNERVIVAKGENWREMKLAGRVSDKKEKKEWPFAVKRRISPEKLT